MYEITKLPTMEISVSAEQENLLPEQKKHIEQVVGKIVAYSNTIAVMAMEDVAEANKTMKFISKKAKELENFRKIFTQKLDAQKSEIMATFKDLAAPLEAEEKRLKSDLLEFEKREAAKAEAEMKARMEEERQKAMQAGIADADFIEVEVVKPKSFTGVTAVKKRTWTVIDFNLIPRGFLMVDEQKINQIRAQYEVENAISPIPGIQFGHDISVRA